MFWRSTTQTNTRNNKFYYMQTQILKGPIGMFGPRDDYEYLLVINPAADVHAQLLHEKQQFYNIYKEKVAIKTRPHITVANFLAKESMEETIIRYMHRIISAKKSFNVILNNFSGFPPHTVYVRVQQHAPFRQMAAEFAAIDQYVRSYGYPAARLIVNPHVTIARKLPEQVYSKAMPEYSKKIFYASFFVDALVLLKRQAGFDACKQVNVFKLLPDETLDATAFAVNDEDGLERLRQGVMSF